MSDAAVWLKKEAKIKRSNETKQKRYILVMKALSAAAQTLALASKAAIKVSLHVNLS